MPELSFEEKYSSKSNSQFVQLKEKGEKLVYRLLGSSIYQGKHFLKDGEDWNVIDCPRINEEEDCKYCQDFFRLKALAKKATGEEQKALEKQARAIAPNLTFFFPVIDRTSEEFKIFKTRLSVRRAIEAKYEAGTKIFDRDFVTVRTENPGANYYTTDVVDSADSKPLTNKEKEAVKLYKTINLSDLVTGKRDEESPITEAENVMATLGSKDESDDIPF